MKAIEITQDGPTDTLIPFRGTATVVVTGTWDGATIELEASFDQGDTFIPLPDSEMSENEPMFNLHIGGCLVRAVAADTTVSTDLRLIISPWS